MTTSVTEQTRQLVEGFYEAGRTGDLEAFLGCLHEEVEIEEPAFLPYGGVYRGVGGFQDLFAQASQLLDVGSIVVESVVADGDRAFGVLRARMVEVDVEVTIAEEWTVRDGKIASGRIYWFDPTPVRNTTGRLSTTAVARLGR